MTLPDAVADRGTRIDFPAGAVLMHHGEPGHDCFIILRGEVLVTATSRQGARIVLNRRGPGAIMGLLSALEPSHRSATVEACTDLETIRLGSRQLQQLLHDNPDFALSELQALARDVRRLTERYALRGDELRSRLARVLTTHHRETNQAEFRSTRQELADWVGATREATTRSLRDLERAGLITLSRGSVTVSDAEQLALMC